MLLWWGKNSAIPTQSFDFTSSLPSGWTLTRTTTGTYINGSGVLTTAAINAARFQTQGLMIEPQVTNFTPDSEDLSAGSYTSSRISVTTNAIAAPDGLTTADKIIANTDNNLHFLFYSTVSLNPTTPSSFSIFLKAAETGYVAMRLDNSSANQIFIAFNLNDMANTCIDANIAASANASNFGVRYEALANDWYRVDLFGAPHNTGTTTRCILYSTDSNGNLSFAGDGTSGFYAWGWQMEQSPRATSYIPTSGATATRGADILTDTTLAYLDATQGAFMVDAEIMNLNGTLLDLSDSAATNRVYLDLDGSGDVDGLSVDGGASAAIGSLGITGFARNKIAIAYKDADMAIAANGLVAGGTPALGAGFDRLNIGSQYNDTDQATLYLKGLNYYDTRLSAAQLKAVTR